MSIQNIISHIDRTCLVGVDEVGRGAWAGPLVVGAVIIDAPVVGLNDSKLVPKWQRAQISQKINECAIATGLGWVWPPEIDELGLTAATSLAIQRALATIPSYDCIVIDGSVNFLPNDSRAITMVGADKLLPAVSAASILAKVARDQYMAEQQSRYPEYGFEAHVGYGTTRHRKAIEVYGITKLHRLSFKPVQAYAQSK